VSDKRLFEETVSLQCSGRIHSRILYKSGKLLRLFH